MARYAPDSNPTGHIPASAEVLALRSDGFLISADPNRLDLDGTHELLNSTVWAARIPRAVMERSIANSICFGVYDEREPQTNERVKQVGFARVVTDRATFAYLCDVVIASTHRGLGLSKRLMECVMAHPELQELRRFQLVTRDAHGLYERYGFKVTEQPGRAMEKLDAEIYKRMSLKRD